MTDKLKSMVSPKSLLPVPLTRAPAGYILVTDPDSHVCGFSKSESKDSSGIDLIPPVEKSAVLPTPPPSLLHERKVAHMPLLRHLGLKETTLCIGASYQLAFGGGTPSIVNAVITNQLLLTLGDFVAMNSVYEEFFVNSFHVDFEPVNRYSGILLGLTPGGSYVQQPLSVVTLHHDTPAYTSHSQSVNNMAFSSKNSADRWSYVWKNIEKKSSTVSLPPQTGEYFSQNWARNTAELNYTGAVQIISPSAFAIAAAGTDLVGTTSVRWVVSFRARK